VSSARLKTSGEVAALVAHIRDPARTSPVLVVTTRHKAVEPLIDVAALSKAVDPVFVRVLPTGDLTWELTALLPDELGVFGGAARIWWPGYADTDAREKHPLYFVWSEAEASAAVRRIARDLAQRGFIEASFVSVEPRRTPVVEGQEVEGTIRALLYHGAEVELSDGRGAYVPVTMIRSPVPAHSREALEVGEVVSGWLTGQTRDGRAELDLRTYDELPQALVVDSIVEGKVVEAFPGGGEIDLGQGVRGWFKPRKGEVLRAGSRVAVHYRGLDGKGRAVLSPSPREQVSPVAPVVDSSSQKPLPAPPRPAPASLSSTRPAPRRHVSVVGAPSALQDEVRRLRERVAEMEEERQGLRQEVQAIRLDRAEAIRSLREQLQAARRDVKAREDALEHLRGRLHGYDVHEDPEEQLRHEVEKAWRRLYTGSDAVDWAMRPYLIGPAFLASVDALQGIERSKIIEVCVDVVTHRAAVIAARDLHPLRVSEAGGSPQRVRPDGATAWRVSLQQLTASARRLHYWQMRDGSVELASVGTHDDMAIP
jgi:hypothetical protein